MQKIKVEAEGGELVLENGSSMAIIPKNKRKQALEYLRNGCNDCLQDMINSLPRAKDYAEDGTLSASQWEGFNPRGHTGGALLIPKNK